MKPHEGKLPTSRPTLRLRAGSTEAVFTWTCDRWTHRIITGGNGPPAEWIGIDGTPFPADDPRWPASPALVELSRVTVPGADPTGTPAVVGVGLAGRSHFSASITPDQREADSIRFEIACRLHERPGQLGSTYRRGDREFRLTPVDDSTALPRTVVWAYSIGPQGITSVHGAEVSSGPA